MPPHDFTQDQVLQEQLSRIQYAPYGLPLNQTTYTLESVGCGWTNDQINNVQVTMRYATEGWSTQISLISHDPQTWLKLERWEQDIYLSSSIEGQSHGLLYDVLLPQLAHRDKEYVTMSNTLGNAIPALMAFPHTQPRGVYQFEYASYKICYTYDDERSIPFAAVSLGFEKAEFNTLLESVIPIDLQNPQTRTFLLRQMSLQFEKRHASHR